MEISDSLLCLFSARIEDRGDGAVIEVPERELGVGDVEEGGSYRVAILGPAGETASRPSGRTERDRRVPEPPLSEGDVREVEIEDMGEQGDGIARVERGYIVFVPETEVGETREIEITDVRENFAFGRAIDDGEDASPGW